RKTQMRSPVLPIIVDRSLASAAHARATVAARELERSHIARYRVLNIWVQVRISVLNLGISRDVVPAQPKVQRQLRIDLEIVLNIRCNRPVPSAQHRKWLQGDSGAADRAQQIT